MNVFYFVGHFVLTGVFFVWLYHRSRAGVPDLPQRLPRWRRGSRVIVHWRFPTAPPRLADVGLEDTLRRSRTSTSARPTSSAFSNPVAAVPSLHAAYALGVGHRSRRSTRGRLVWTVVGVVYPPLVVLTIVVTGNHFILDAIAGVAVLARRLRRRLASRRGPRRREQARHACPT